VRLCSAKGGNVTMGVMALMDTRLFERYAIIINYHRHCVGDSVLAATSVSPVGKYSSIGSKL